MLNKDRYSNPQHLKDEQYNNSDKLSARIRLHQNYGTSDEGVPQLIFNLMLEDIPDNANILEIGTGRGDLWLDNAHCIPNHWRITLTDISAGMLEDNQEHLGDLSGRMSYDVVNAVNIPYGDNSFDVVLANYMLYHVPDRPKAIGEIRRVLKPDGVLFAATNGNNHMKRIYIFAEHIDEVTQWKSLPEETFGLQNGTGQLMPYFTDIRMVQVINDLWIPTAQPIIDYIASMVTIDGAEIIQQRENDIRVTLNNIITEDGGVLIEKETGVFIARGTPEKKYPR